MSEGYQGVRKTYWNKQAPFSEFEMVTCDKCKQTWCPEEEGVRAVHTKWGVFCEYCIDEARDHAKDDLV